MLHTTIPLTTPTNIDPERLAALLDGRLNDTEATAVRAQLASADEDTLAAYADAVAVFAEMNPSPVVSIESARRRRWFIPAMAAAAAAAAIAGVALRPSAYEPAMYASAVPLLSHSSAEPMWSVTRGGVDGVSDRARSIRIGALLTDLQVDAIHGDPAKTHASALATLIEGRLGNGARAAALREFVNSSSTTLTADQAKSLGQQAVGATDRSLMRVGAYLEAARIASASGDVGFFDRSSMTVLSSLGADAQRVSSLIEATPRDAIAIHAAVETLLRQLAQ